MTCADNTTAVDFVLVNFVFLFVCPCAYVAYAFGLAICVVFYVICRVFKPHDVVVRLS